MLPQIWYIHLFCAEEAMQDDDLLIAYGDIVFNDNVLTKYIKK